MDRLNINSGTKKNQSDYNEIQDFFRSKADLDKPILSSSKKQSKGVKKKLKIQKGLLFTTNSIVDDNISAADCLMTTSQQIGTILKAKRKAKGLTQKQLAVLAYNEITYQGLISRIESGTYKEIRFQDVTIILSAFGVDLIELILNTNLNNEIH